MYFWTVFHDFLCIFNFLDELAFFFITMHQFSLKTAPLLVTVPIETEKVLTCINVSFIIIIIQFNRLFEMV